MHFLFDFLLSAAIEGLEELKVSDSTGSNDDQKQCKVSWAIYVYSDTLIVSEAASTSCYSCKETKYAWGDRTRIRR